jgi:hypothetical protein
MDPAGKPNDVRKAVTDVLERRVSGGVGVLAVDGRQVALTAATIDHDPRSSPRARRPAHGTM